MAGDDRQREVGRKSPGGCGPGPTALIPLKDQVWVLQEMHALQSLRGREVVLAEEAAFDNRNRSESEGKGIRRGHREGAELSPPGTGGDGPAWAPDSLPAGLSDGASPSYQGEQACVVHPSGQILWVSVRGGSSLGSGVSHLRAAGPRPGPSCSWAVAGRAGGSQCQRGADAVPQMAGITPSSVQSRRGPEANLSLPLEG